MAVATFIVLCARCGHSRRRHSGKAGHCWSRNHHWRLCPCRHFVSGYQVVYDRGHRPLEEKA